MISKGEWESARHEVDLGYTNTCSSGDGGAVDIPSGQEGNSYIVRRNDARV